MSRIEENKKMIDLLYKVEFTSGDAAMRASVLTDISQSLAVIADCCLDKWQKDQVDRFMSMSQEDRKLFSDYMKQDETEIIISLRNAMPKQEELYKLDKCVDLCPDCYEHFIKWLSNENETKEKEQIIGSGELYPGEFESRHYDFEEEPNE